MRYRFLSRGKTTYSSLLSLTLKYYLYSNVTEQSSESTGNDMHHVVPVAYMHSVADAENLQYFQLASGSSDTLNVMQHYHPFAKKVQQQLNLGLCFYARF